MKNLDKANEFRITEFDLFRKRQPLTSWAVAHLFYGVPRRFKYCYKEPTTGDLVFKKKI